MKQIGWLFVVLTITSFTNANENEDDDNLTDLRSYLASPASQQPGSIPKTINSDIKRQRSYPMQPPIIPHDTRGYEINLKVNKCMTCHSRTKTEASQAPMVSVTHFMDRDGNFLAEISPRRYFCNQCHVTQQDVKEQVENDFVDMHQLIKQASSKNTK